MATTVSGSSKPPNVLTTLSQLFGSVVMRGRVRDTRAARAVALELPPVGPHAFFMLAIGFLPYFSLKGGPVSTRGLHQSRPRATQAPAF